jgi:para-nitrobenzyl esterase
LTIGACLPRVPCVKGVVSVAQGRLRGVWRGDLWSFSGIPYARAPIGALRWRPPLEAEGWDAIRDASTFGPIAPQPAAVPGITSPSDPSASEPHSEDCLSLNVWTPELPGDATGPGRPVMVFIHGGGFTSGSGSVFLYRGGELVRNGDAVVVTINYRLGALGFLGHRDLADPDGLLGNWGLHDQLAALRWVRENIASFGGDPDAVTVFGESAGGFSVAALLGLPAAKGLFRRAIVQSGGAHVHTRDQAEASAERLAAMLGAAACTREAFERIPAAELVAATEELGRRRPDPGMIPLPFLPAVDGVFLPRHPLVAVADGSAEGVDLLIGTNRDELTLFGLGNPALMALDADGVTSWVGNAAPDLSAPRVMDAYRSARSARGESCEPHAMWVAVGTDIVFRWPSLQLAAAHGSRGAASYVYLFDWESPAFGGILGSCHALELPFVFGAVRLPVVQVFSGQGPAVEALSSAMQRAWLAFASTGDPSHEGIGTWRRWEPSERATMIFGAETRLEAAPRDEELTSLAAARPLSSRFPG